MAATREQALSALEFLRNFMPKGEYEALRGEPLRGEEAQFFFDKLLDYEQRIKTMPETYQQDEKGGDAIVYLHYFVGSADWFILELDYAARQDQHVQAFGLADLYGDSIPEVIEAGAELDLYWEPKPLREVRK
jgi:hypothetical protein